MGDGSYALGETIRVTLSFSEAVEVTGAPRLAIDMDPADWGRKWAAYEGGSGTSNIRFAHTVVQPNFSSQGIAVLANTLELNGGTIRSASSQADADLSHPGKEHDDPQHKVDWQLAPASPNQAPVVNSGTQNYEWFVNEQNAPRGMLVSKSFAGLFTDPDGDQLTYSAAITGGRAQLLDDLAIGSWGRSDLLAAQSPWPREATQRVFIEVDDDDDWDSLEPPLAARPVITVTVTATDPTGLSASVSGKFLIIWTRSGAMTQLNLDDAPANGLGPQDAPPAEDPEQGDEDQAAGPTVTDVAVTSDAGSDDTYELGDTILDFADLQRSRRRDRRAAAEDRHGSGRLGNEARALCERQRHGHPGIRARRRRTQLLHAGHRGAREHAGTERRDDSVRVRRRRMRLWGTMG